MKILKDKAHGDSSVWVIVVVGYGAFFFEGTEEEAEEMRVHKSRWEQGVGLKRLATPEEIKSGEASYCVNHPAFKRKWKYEHECQDCKPKKKKVI